MGCFASVETSSVEPLPIVPSTESGPVSLADKNQPKHSIINNPQPRPHAVSLKPNEKAQICVCGQSLTFPICDFSHEVFNEKYNTKYQPFEVSATDFKSYYICGCGHSQKLPFCDGSHVKLIDLEKEDILARATAYAKGKSRTSVTVKDNERKKLIDIANPQCGPYQIELKLSEDINICRCGQSSKFPKCDGAHLAYNKKHGTNIKPRLVNSLEETSLYVCGCGYSDNDGFCNGAHLKLTQEEKDSIVAQAKAFAKKQIVDAASNNEDVIKAVEVIGAVEHVNAVENNGNVVENTLNVVENTDNIVENTLNVVENVNEVDNTLNTVEEANIVGNTVNTIENTINAVENTTATIEKSNE